MQKVDKWILRGLVIEGLYNEARTEDYSHPNALEITVGAWGAVPSDDAYALAAGLHQHLTTPPAAGAAGEAYQWPAPLPFPAHKPEVDEEHYYCLTARFPKTVQLLMWKDPNDNSEPPTWCSWDGDYWEPLLGTVTHFWPLPTPPADAA